MNLDCPRIRSFGEWLHAPAQFESMHPRFDVRRAVPEEFDRIYDLINEGYSLQRSRARYDWMYRRNPYGTARCWLAFDRCNGQVIANLASWPWPMARGTRWAEGCVTGDLVVAREWQGQGMADLCIKASRSHAWQAKSLRFAWPNEKSVGSEIKHGREAEILGPVPLAVLILNSRRYLAERQWPALLSALAGAAIDSGLTMWTRVVLRNNSRSTIEAVRRFDASFDEVTGRCMSWSGFWSPHNAEFLNWRYFEDPSSEHVAFALIDGNNVEGYYVIKIQGRASWLMEFAAPASSGGFTSALLLHLIGTARAAGCSRIRFSAPSWRHWKLFRAAGFLPVPSDIYTQPWLNDDEPERGQLSSWQWVPGDMDAV